MLAMNLLYPVGKHLYVNLTNKCPCNCTFCIRQNGDGVYGSDSLWLAHEPDFAEMQAAFTNVTLADWEELVFCGYGEPTMRLDLLCQVARYAKSLPGCPPIRLNTNGLSDRIHGRATAPDLQGLFDTVSISLNAGTEATYLAVTRPQWEDAFSAMQQYALACKAVVPQVLFTVVDVIAPEEIAAAQALANELGIPLRVRRYDS